uniref:EF-hand domain-containing protein n=1 Tax=Chromera velia CCMP2878 TaxID=1169474 RepID=A0A0K6S974_9ALVE|eukprot:Cvel_6792.t1-p1 / transcript=Cvel_6792.t1 / gene=Cvel_6792 / organism=Chromera_velia_CCMP2878 / gene_product=Mechanosensitive ion channel protein 6, putative / transcript_product=Mechanosensitive ion channel protein 6, putative / location=Cvel_scaffold341:57897-66668(+) / protein_length=942 / sequence_SO=supercontig / SO=protein_coding / is_pseudo=false
MSRNHGVSGYRGPEKPSIDPEMGLQNSFDTLPEDEPSGGGILTSSATATATGGELMEEIPVADAERDAMTALKTPSKLPVPRHSEEVLSGQTQMWMDDIFGQEEEKEAPAHCTACAPVNWFLKFFHFRALELVLILAMLAIGLILWGVKRYHTIEDGVVGQIGLVLVGISIGLAVVKMVTFFLRRLIYFLIKLCDPSEKSAVSIVLHAFDPSFWHVLHAILVLVMWRAWFQTGLYKEVLDGKPRGGDCPPEVSSKALDDAVLGFETGTDGNSGPATVAEILCSETARTGMKVINNILIIFLLYNIKGLILAFAHIYFSMYSFKTRLGEVQSILFRFDCWRLLDPYGAEDGNRRRKSILETAGVRLSNKHVLKQMTKTRARVDPSFKPDGKPDIVVSSDDESKKPKGMGMTEVATDIPPGSQRKLLRQRTAQQRGKELSFAPNKQKTGGIMGRGHTMVNMGNPDYATINPLAKKIMPAGDSKDLRENPMPMNWWQLFQAVECVRHAPLRVVAGGLVRELNDKRATSSAASMLFKEMVQREEDEAAEAKQNSTRITAVPGGPAAGTPQLESIQEEPESLVQVIQDPNQIERGDSILSSSGGVPSMHSSDSLALPHIHSRKKFITFLDLRTLRRYLPEPMVDRFVPFVDPSGDGKVTKREFVSALLMTYKDREALAKSLQSHEGIADVIVTICNFGLWVVLLFAGLYVFGVLSQFLLTVSSFVVAIGFAIGGSLTNLVSSLVFVFVQHPFDIGDRVVVEGVRDGMTMVVKKISVMTTSFITITGQYVQVPNFKLSNANILNEHRSGSACMLIRLRMYSDTTGRQIYLLQKALTNFCKERPHEWIWKEIFYLTTNVAASDFIEWEAYIPHKLAWCHWQIIYPSRDQLFFFTVKEMKKLDIKYTVPPQPIYFGRMPSSISERLPGGSEMSSQHDGDELPSVPVERPH